LEVLAVAPSVDLAFLPEADLPQATPAVVLVDHQQAIQGADLAVRAAHPQAIVAVEVADLQPDTAAVVVDRPVGPLLDTAVVEPVALLLDTVVAVVDRPVGPLLDTAVVEPAALLLDTVVEVVDRPVGPLPVTAVVEPADLLPATVAVGLLQAIILGPNFYPQVKSVLLVDREPERWDCAEVRQDRQAPEPDRLDPEVALVWI
jgi:hypothetical protein